MTLKSFHGRDGVGDWEAGDVNFNPGRPWPSCLTSGKSLYFIGPQVLSL